MNIVPTLNFGGNCREAIKMYEKAFNGKIVCLITYRDANDPAYMPLLSEEQKDYIYHAELILDRDWAGINNAMMEVVAELSKREEEQK